MNKFEFRLEALLKLREFKEKKLKLELGTIQKEIVELKSMIRDLHEHIKLTYEAQEKVMEQPSSAQFLQFFPLYIKSKKDDIKNKELLLEKLEAKFRDKMAEVTVARGESKVVESMKQKEMIKFKKQVEKKEMQNIEELIMMRKQKSDI